MYLKNSCFGRDSLHFWQIIKFKERSSGVGTPIVGDLKQNCLALAKRWLYTNELLVKLLRASFMCLQNFATRIFLCFFCFCVVVFWLKSQLASSPFHPNWGSQHHLNMFNVIKCQKWCKIPFQTHEIFRDFMNNYTTSCEYAFFWGGHIPFVEDLKLYLLPP